MIQPSAFLYDRRARARRARDHELRSRIGEAIDAGRRLDPADADDAAAADFVFRERIRPALIQAVRDPQQLAQTLPAVARDIERIRVVPGDLVDLADAWWTSRDPTLQAGAARAV